MKTHFLSILACAAPLFAPIVSPAAFNPGVVSADARWIVHVDLVALRESDLGQSLLGGLQQIAPMLAEGGLQLDFEKILSTAGTITAYGTNFSKDPATVDGTLIVQGTADLRKIAEGFVAQAMVTDPDQVVTLEGLPFEAYSFAGGQVTIAFPPEPVILFSKSQAKLLQAYEVFRGEAASLAKSPRSPLNDLLPKSGRNFLLAASFVPTEGFMPQDAPQARILQLVSAGAIAVGEVNATTSARLELVASSDETAGRLDRILQGMTALISLTNSNDQHLKEFLQSVTTERNGSRVSLSLAYSSERLVGMMQAMHEHGAMMHDHGHSGAQANNHSERAAAAPTEKIGQVVDTWNAEADLAGDSPRAENLTTHVTENVALRPGMTISISGRRGGGEHARVDFVEVAPAPGTGPAQRYEAEFMRLENYQIEKLTFASGGELVRMSDRNDTGTVRFHFQGAEGTYRVTVGIVDETDGQSAYALGVLDPTALESTGSSTP